MKKNEELDEYLEKLWYMKEDGEDSTGLLKESFGDLYNSDVIDTLFADGDLRAAWAEARGQAPQRRVRLRIDHYAAELHALPWELLQQDAVMLSANTDTPFSRYLPIALPWGGAVLERPIRVLVVISNPTDLQSKYDLAPVDVDLERGIMETALEAIGPDELQVDFLEAPVTAERLEDALRGTSGQARARAITCYTLSGTERSAPGAGRPQPAS